MKLITVDESVVNAIVEYHAQGSEEAHAEGNRMFLRGTQRVAVEAARKQSLAAINKGGASL
ncbi:TPA: hypothetical protein MIH51_28390 [Klebsiella pneumoniae]|nr:hypothetical protein [Klebsiella pneumoniae]